MNVARVFEPLLQPARFKGAYGGRASGKSFFFCEMLIRDAVRQHVRVACMREFQNSIKESVKQTLDDIIRDYNLRALFRSTDTEIRGPHESLFVFKGLHTNTEDTVRSFKGFNRALFEEAQSFSQKSLDAAIPTFLRSPDSELLFAWNPYSAKDPVDRMFRKDNLDENGKLDPRYICVEANWRDNPWLPEASLEQLLAMRERDPNKYAHMWMGGYRKETQARIFRNWKIAKEPLVPPYNTRFYLGADWGFTIDPTVLICCYIDDKTHTLYIYRELWKKGCTQTLIPALFDQLTYNGKPLARKWPITADSANPDNIYYLKNNGYPLIKPSIKGKNSVDEGIEWLQSFTIIVDPSCEHTIDELAEYSFKVDKKTEEVIPIFEDKNNHLIDALRYATEDTRRAPLNISDQVLKRASFSPAVEQHIKQGGMITDAILKRAGRRY